MLARQHLRAETGADLLAASLLLPPAFPAALASFPGTGWRGELKEVVYYHILPGSLKQTHVNPPQLTLIALTSRCNMAR